MTTHAQQAANQRNAQKSTGPRTGDGKKRARMNAIRHGGYLQVADPISATFLCENPDELRDLYDAVIEDLAPTSTLQCTQAAAIAQQIINQARVAKLTAAAASGEELAPDDDRLIGRARDEHWYWEHLSWTLGNRHETAHHAIPYGDVACEIRKRHPEVDFGPQPSIPVAMPFDEALEVSRAEVLRLSEKVYGSAEAAFHSMMVVRHQVEPHAERETRIAHGIEAKRLIASFDKTNALQERISRMIARDLKNYRDLKLTEAELFDFDRDADAEPEDELEADATTEEPQDADPPRNEPNPII